MKDRASPAFQPFPRANPRFRNNGGFGEAGPGTKQAVAEIGTGAYGAKAQRPVNHALIGLAATALHLDTQVKQKWPPLP